MVLKLSNLPRKDVLAHVVDKKPNNYFDDEIDIYFDGVLPGGDVTKSYVDEATAEALTEAKAYTDSEIAKIPSGGSAKLYSGFGENTDGAVTQKFFTDSIKDVADNVSGVTDSLDDIEADVDALKTSKQDTLVSGTNIKTVNGKDLLGTGDIEITSEPETLSVSEFNTLWENA